MQRGIFVDGVPVLCIRRMRLAYVRRALSGRSCEFVQCCYVVHGKANSLNICLGSSSVPERSVPLPSVERTLYSSISGKARKSVRVNA